MFVLHLVLAIELLNLNDENFFSDESYEGVMLMIRLSENAVLSGRSILSYIPGN